MRTILLVLFFLALAGNVHGQGALEGVSVSVEVLNLTTVGADVDQGQVFTIQEAVEGRGAPTQRTSTVDYGASFRPIETKIGERRALLWSAGYRRGDWGVSVRRWNMEGDASYQERITSSPSRLVSSPTSLSFSQTVQGCRMWDHTLVSVQNVRDPSGFSPMDCSASNALRASKMDIMLERVWIRGPTFQAIVKIGTSVGRVEHQRKEGQEQNALIEGMPFQDSSGRLIDRFTNRITLDSTGEADGRFVGPSVELAGSFGFSRLQADWRVNQAMLIGDVDLTGEWNDVDRTSIAGRLGNIVPFTESVLLQGRYPLSEKKRTAVPVLDSHVKVSYRIVDMVSAGAGYFVSSWLGIPMASSWSVPGEWTGDAGTHWKRNESNLVFHGVTVFAQLSF